MFIAQLDLKRAFDRISHGSTAEMLRRKNLCPQLVAVLLQLVVLQFSGSPFGPRDVRSLYLGGSGSGGGAARSARESSGFRDDG